MFAAMVKAGMIIFAVTCLVVAFVIEAVRRGW